MPIKELSETTPIPLNFLKKSGLTLLEISSLVPVNLNSP